MFSERIPQGRLVLKDFSLANTEQLDKYDLGVILGNALDNAIEAAERVKESKIVIELSSKRKGKMLLLNIKNPHSGEELKRDYNGLPISTKTKGTHGIGLYNIRRIALKYSGMIKISTTEREFILSVMLKLP